MDNLQLLDVIAGTLYSSRETQMSSYNLGKYVVENNIEGDIIECGVASRDFEYIWIQELIKNNNKHDIYFIISVD